MSIIATYANTTELQIHHFVADASELGIPVGVVCTRLPTTMGNGQDFLLAQKGSDRWVYTQAFGCLTLVVFND